MSERRWLGFGLKFICSGVLLWLVLRRLDPEAIVSRLRGLDPRYAALALLLWTANLFLASWRWSLLSLGLIPLGQAFRYTWIGFFFGSVLPGTFSGDLAKGISLGLKDKTKGTKLLTISIFLDKIVGFFTLLLFFNFAMGWLLFRRPELFGRLRPAAVFGLAASIACLGGLVGFWRFGGNRRIGAWIERLPLAFVRRYARQIAQSFTPYRHEYSIVLQAIGLSAVMHSVVIVVYWVIFTAVDPGATLAFVAVFYPLISIVLLVPASISGIGLRDAFSAMMFSAFGLHPEAGVAVSWLMLALNAPIVLVGAAIQTLEFFRRARPLKN